MDSETLKWNPLPDTVYNRRDQTVISVPDDWLCTHRGLDTKTADPSSTTPTSESTTSGCPDIGTCERVDSRGVDWMAGYGETIYKNCFETPEEGEGRAFWYCDGCQADFATPEPDRSACIAQWIRDAEESISSGSISTEEATQLIVENVNIDGDSTAGSIEQLSSLMNILLNKRTEEEEEDNEIFSANIINSTNAVFRSRVGWNEFGTDTVKNGVTSTYLKQIDQAGFLWASSAMEDSRRGRPRSEDCRSNKTFAYSDLTVIAKTSSQEIDLECFLFTKNGSICIQ